MFRRLLPLTLLLVNSFAVSLFGDEISINFNNTTDPAWAISPATPVGPLNSANWNNTSTASGTQGGLVDSNGIATAASINWSSANTWSNGDNNGTPERILLHPYLDDGGSGVSITVTNIPYAEYRVYGLLSSDQTGDNTAYNTLDFNVNGNAVLGGVAVAASDWDYALNNFSGNFWRETTINQIGNYWLSASQTSSTLTITAPARNGAQRSSIAGIIIQDVTAVPEPGGLLVLAAGALALTIQRRKQ